MTLPLREALEQCSRHAAVMQAAMADLPAVFDVATVLAEDPQQVRATDSFVLRFIKLQDTLGEHVLRSFAVQILAEPVSDLPLIDVLNRLERYGYLEAARWARWRTLRNGLTHDYPGQPEIRVAVLEEARRAAVELADLLALIRARTQQPGA